MVAGKLLSSNVRPVEQARQHDHNYAFVALLLFQSEMEVNRNNKDRYSDSPRLVQKAIIRPDQVTVFFVEVISRANGS
jgi:hypothetical protein